MDHPDEMTQMEEFRILLEEDPQRAEAILNQGAHAVHALVHLRDNLFSTVEELNRREGRHPLTSVLAIPEHPAQVAADYGILSERYDTLVDAVNGSLRIAVHTLAYTYVPPEE